MHYLAHACDVVILLFQIYEFHTLSATAHHSATCHRETDGNATLVDDHEVFIILYCVYCEEFTCLVRNIECLDTLFATVSHAVILHLSALAESLFAHHHNGVIIRVMHYNHSNYLIVRLFIQ